MLLLALPKHDQSHLPVPTFNNRTPAVPTRTRRLLQAIADHKETMRIVFEFRSKLRTTEELISKLAYCLREIQGAGCGPLKAKRRLF